MDRKLEGKVTVVTTRVPHTLYERFKMKALSEGYSMQEATYLLIEHYTNDTLIVKNEKP